MRLDRTAGLRFAVHGGQKTAAYFNARRFRLKGADQAGRNVAIDLGELILVDGRLAAVTWRPVSAAKRPEHGEDRRSRHQREHKPQCHRAGSGRRKRHRCPLYTTTAEPGN